MEAKNKLNEVKERMAKLKSERNAELAKISTELTAARSEKAAAEKTIKEASETLDFDKYEKAKHAAAKADFKIEMLSDRYTQITRREYMTEEESDKVIDSLKAYEEEANAKYRADIAGPLKDLERITAAYEKEINDTEHTIKHWCHDIHANYRSERTTYQNGTNRSETPVPVRVMPYFGTEAAASVKRLLTHETIAGILEEK